MAIDTSIPRSRRALLAGGVGGLAAVAASALGRPLPTRAGTDGDVVLGALNSATDMTLIQNTTNSMRVLLVESLTGIALGGDSESGIGIAGFSHSNAGISTTSVESIGMLARSLAPDQAAAYARSTGHGCGLVGQSCAEADDLVAAPVKTGVYGYAAQDSKSVGVKGKSIAGAGVSGESLDGDGVLGHTSSGIGVVAHSGTGIGLSASSLSGVAVDGWAGSTTKAAILGTSGGDNTGVHGHSGDIAGSSPAKTGVYGYAAQDSKSVGVAGESVAGVGVRGESGSGAGVGGLCDTGIGVLGHSQSGVGVSGSSSYDIGVDGWSGSTTKAAIVGASGGDHTGVHGHSGDIAGPSPAKTGVYGYAVQDANARGVHGRSAGGRGVYGQASTGVGAYGYASSGTGVVAATTTGYALRTSGRLKVDKASGVATILAGRSGVVVAPGLDVTTASFVLLTPRGDLGPRRLWYTTSPTTNEFTIRLSSAVTTSLNVGWLLLG